MGSSRPGNSISALLPTFRRTASVCEMWAFAISFDVFITVRSGWFAVASSPWYCGRSVTTPSIGLRISE